MKRPVSVRRVSAGHVEALLVFLEVHKEDTRAELKCVAVNLSGKQEVVIQIKLEGRCVNEDGKYRIFNHCLKLYPTSFFNPFKHHTNSPVKVIKCQINKGDIYLALMEEVSNVNSFILASVFMFMRNIRLRTCRLHTVL